MAAFRVVCYGGADVPVPVPEYAYTPFEAGSRQFRLLTLDLDARYDATIKASLNHYTLDDHPEYTALSYEWGDPSQVIWMLIDAIEFPVTENLARALQALRAKNCPLIWIDAICIDQNNEREKAAHIPIMTGIYHEAEAVCAWVGPDKVGSDKVMDILQAMDLSRKPNISEVPWRPDMGVLRRCASQIQSFFDRTYWRRVWIIQELSVASRIYVICGSKLVSWAGLDLLLTCLQDLKVQQNKERLKSRSTFKKSSSAVTNNTEWNLSLLTESPALKHISRLMQSRMYKFEGRPVGLLENVYQAGGAKATDFRDQVFALLGLSFDSAAFVRNPTYTCTESDLCIEMTKTFIWSKKSLDIMFLAGANAGGDTAPLLPTWCPTYLHLQAAAHSNVLCTYLSGHAEQHRLGVKGSRWRATGDSLVTHGSVGIQHNQRLIVFGKRICSIKSIGVNSDATSPVTSNLDAQQEVDEEVTAKTINDALILYSRNSHHQSETPSTLRYLFHFDDSARFNSGQVSELKHRFEQVLRWRQLNEDLVIGKRTFKKTAKSVLTSFMAPDTTNWPFLEMLTRGIVSGVADGLMGESSPRKSYSSTQGDRLINPEMVEALSSLQDLIDEGLAFISTTENFHVGWAHPEARPRDEIFLLAGCSMPAILRRRDHSATSYTVVGHAYLDALMDGSHWSRLSRNDIEEIGLI